MRSASPLMEFTSGEPGQNGRAAAMASACEESRESGSAYFPVRRCHEFWQEQRLVDHGRAHVHVEDRRAEGHLLGGEPHGEAVFPGLQFRLQIFLARGIDAFADDLERLGGADAHQPGTGGQHDAGRRHRRGGTGADGVDGPAQGRDVIRGRAAAAAHKPRAHADEGRRLFGERLGGQAEHRVAVHQVGQARVGLGQHPGTDEQARKRS